MTDDPIVVIGAGIVGASLAYHLRTGSRPVRVLEKGRPGRGTTGASAGQFTHHQGHPDRDEYRRRQLAWEWYRDRIRRDDLRFDRVGTYHVGATPADADELRRAATTLRSFGAAAEYRPFEAGPVAGVPPDRFTGGLWLPDDGVLDPFEVVEHSLAAARGAGVTVETGVPVTGVTTEDGSVTGVRTDDGPRPSTTVVNAAGPWATHVNDLAGVSVPLRHTRGPMVELETDLDRAVPLTLLPDGFYVRHSPALDGGLLVGRFDTDYERADRLEPAKQTVPDGTFRSAARRMVESLFPDIVVISVREQYLGLRTVTPDGIPIVDQSPISGFFLACGLSGYGVTLAPGIGDLLAEWLGSGNRPALLDSLARDRF